MQHVIIGSGPAGVVAAEVLRTLDPASSISLFGGEGEVPYSRMALPYLLEGCIDETGTHLRKAADHFEHNGIQLINRRVTAIDPTGSMITLSDGSNQAYDRLLLATGSHPVQPPISGIELPGVHSCWTLADARIIAEQAEAGTQVVLIGAGFIGSIILESLVARGVVLTVIETGDRMVPRMLDPQCGNLLKTWCQNKGVAVLTSTSVASIEQQGFTLIVHTEQGQAIPAQLVISATGVAANLDLATGCGIDTDLGILVDSCMQTSAAGVYAAGDVAQGKDFSTGGYNVQAIQPTAVDHARVAANNMVSPGSIHHPGSLNMNILDTLGLISASFGCWQGVDGGESVTMLDAKNFRYINLQFEDDMLIGANTLGHFEHLGVLRGLIQSRSQLGVWQQRLMADPSQIMPAYLSTLMP